MVLCVDITFKIFHGLTQKLLAVFYFDKEMRRRPLLLAVIGSESKRFFDPILRDFRITSNSEILNSLASVI